MRLRIFCLLFLCCLCACSRKDSSAPEKRVMVTSVNKLISTLDPAVAADTVCQYMTAAFYDTPLQYSFSARPYRLEPAMLETMPSLSADGKVLTCRIRKDLLFQKNPCFPDEKSRRITAQDFVFSILRIADPRVRSTGFWLIRGKIQGLEEFRRRAGHCPEYDLSPYNSGCSGLRVLDTFTFEIHLVSPDPRFVYALAMPYFSVVSRRACEYWKGDFSDHPAGSGPFLLKEWNKDHVIRLVRNPEFRKELFPQAEVLSDRSRQLPLLDGITCYLVRQPVAGWLMFLQGELDSFVLDNDDFTSVIGKDGNLAGSLLKRGISLLRAPEAQINYIGFNFRDPLLGSNENLRKAITLAFDKSKRVRQTGGRLTEAYGPVPPGTAGFLPDPGEFGKKNIPLAKEYMKKAGFPDGIDPKTGKNLVLHFDQAGSTTFHRQTAELLSLDMKEIGIQIQSEGSSRPMFLQKLRQGEMQLFRLSWTGDYPDAENFLQLFYSPNGGASNRAWCSIPEFDARFRKLLSRPPSPELDREYESLARYIRSRCPWIFESFTVAFLLKHKWLTNFIPHDFAFNRWKYYSVDPRQREEIRNTFVPLSLRELRE